MTGSGPLHANRLSSSPIRAGAGSRSRARPTWYFAHLGARCQTMRSRATPQRRVSAHFANPFGAPPTISSFTKHVPSALLAASCQKHGETLEKTRARLPIGYHHALPPPLWGGGGGRRPGGVGATGATQGVEEGEVALRGVTEPWCSGCCPRSGDGSRISAAVWIAGEKNARVGEGKVSQRRVSGTPGTGLRFLPRLRAN